MPEDQASLRRARHADLQAALDRQPDGVSRRRFLELLGASLALTGAAACANPRDKIVPYVRTPQDVQPGTPLYFATAHVLGGFADGVLVESHEGRPTKVEGNPQHPASLGATDVFAQASLLTLYEPTRSQTPTFQGQIRTWLDFVRDMRATLAGVQATGGAGLRILTESVTSPSLAAQIQQVLNAFPGARWHRWQPVNRDNVLAGAALAFGTALSPRYRFDAANVVLSLDADPLADWEPGHVRYSRDLASRRQPERGALNRIYAVENTWSSLGSVADHRLALQAAAIEPLAWSLAAALGVNVPSVAPPANVPAEWLAAAVDDLRAAGANGLVLAGPTQPPAVHALAHAMNSQLGSIGTTVELTDPIEADPVQHAASLRELTDALAGGGVDVLLILGGNPAYTASADIPFASNLRTCAREACIWACSTTRRRTCATGTFRPCTRSKPGAMREPTMARRPSCSR
jgi:hypothetical protein